MVLILGCSCKLMPAYLCADGRIADSVCVSTVVIWTAAGETGADSSRWDWTTGDKAPLCVLEGGGLCICVCTLGSLILL